MKAEKALSLQSNDKAVKNVMSYVVHMILGIVLCRGEIFGSLSPFGASYVSAVGKKQLFWSTLGVSLGYIILKPNEAFRYVMVTISIALGRWVLQDIKAVRKSMLFSPLVTFIPMVASGIVLMYAKTSTLTDFSMVIVEAVIASGVAFFMNRSLFLVNTGRRISTLSQSELASMVMTGCILILSLGNVQLQGVSLGRIFAIVIILLCARYGSVTGGTIAGISTGSVFGISESGLGFVCAGYGFGGLMAGLFAPTGKLCVAISFLISNCIMAFSSQSNDNLMPLVAETIIGSAVFMVLPQNFEGYITPLFLPKENSKKDRSLKNSVVMRLGLSAKALENVSECVNSVSRHLEKHYASNVNEIYEKTATDICSSCGLRVYCWEHERKSTQKDFMKLSTPIKEKGFITENDVENIFEKKCCRQLEIAEDLTHNYREYLNGIEANQRINQIRSLVAGQFTGLSEILKDMSTEFENYKTYDPDGSRKVIEYFHNKGLVPIECSCLVESNGRMSVEIQLAKGKTKLKSNVIARDISNICGRCFDTPLVTDLGTQKRIVLNEVPVFDVKVGVYQHIFKNGTLCGDCVKSFSNGFGEFVVMISDGMGTGGRAAVDSNMTVSIMSKLLKSGLSENSALQIVNSALMIKSQDESLATVDLMKINLFNGKVQLNKAGAPLTYIKKKGHLFKKTATAMPIGILGSINFTSEHITVGGGDTIIMFSDGALVNDGENIEKTIKSWSEESPAECAKAIVNSAIKSRNDGYDDDITAVVIKVYENA